MKWKTVTLKEIASDIQTGPFGSQLHQSDYATEGIPVVMPKDLVDGRISETSIAKVEQSHVDRLQRHKISAGDILFSRRGDVGRCAFTTGKEENWLCGTGCLRVTIDKHKANPKFVFYQLQLPQAVDWFEKHAIGSTMLNLNTNILSLSPVQIPDLATQHRIADILSSYDDLIENNQKQIALLEEAAQRLYKEWFVDLRFPGHEKTPITDGVPEGWRKESINDIGDYLNGYPFKPSDWKTVGMPIIKIKELNEGITSNTPRNNGENIPSKYLIKAGDIIFSWSATLTAKIWDNEDGLLNQHLFKVTPDEEISREFVFQSILHALDEFANLTTGATMKHIQRGKLQEVFVVVPGHTFMEQFASISEPIRNKILALQKSTLLAKEARDRLLPKLMGGEMEV